MNNNKSLAIIGGGAAGYFAAIAAAELNNGCNIEIFEASTKVLSKVLISGGGRCNVTNHTLDPKILATKYPRGGQELLGAFSRFKVQDTLEWFEKKGVKLKVEKDNRVFPITDSSSTIADCLKNTAKSLNIKLNINSKVTSINKVDESFRINLANNEEKYFSKIILASGSQQKGFEMAKSLGHSIINPVPSLFTFEIKSPVLEGLSGVSFEDVEVNLKVKDKAFKNTGPLLITHWGLSGPAVIVLSAIAARELFENDYKANLKINLLLNKNFDHVYESLLKIKLENPKKMVVKNNPFSMLNFQNIPNSFWTRITELLEIKENLIWAETPNKTLKQITKYVISLNLEVSGKGKFKEEFVTAGGINLKEVDFKTMESKICPGLFFAGEVLDIDGVTGGFNFQAAWSTGYIAGHSASS